MARVWLEKDGRVFADLAGKVGLCTPDGIDFNEKSLGRRGGLNTRPEKANPLSAGDEVVSPTMSEGKLEITNSKTKQVRTVQSKVTGLGVAIYSLGSELDGKLYGGGLKPAAMFEIDLATGQMRDLGVLGQGKTQVYHVLAHGGGLYQSSYAEGSITYYDPKQPIEKGVNPQEIITLAKTDDQERAQELVLGPDGMIYAGTIPVKGQLGGVLLRIDPADKSTRVWRNLVPNQSLISMESVPATGEMFVTTTIGGGSTAIPTEKEAVVFLWNCKEEKISWQGKPVPGAISYGKARHRRRYLCDGQWRPVLQQRCGYVAGGFVSPQLTGGAICERDRSADGTSASDGRAGRITRSYRRSWSGRMRPDRGGAAELPIHAQGRIFPLGAVRP